MKIAVFDLETKLKPGKVGKEEGAECGWNEKDKMGISVGVSFDYVSGEYKTFLDDNIMELWELLNDMDVITGFAIRMFDIPLLVATVINIVGEPARKNIEAKGEELISKSYDILPVSKSAAGVTQFTKGYKLDQHLGLMYPHMLKTASGAMAPVMYKEGRMGELISYCVADVHRERLMFEHCWYAGWLKTEGHPEPYDVERPQAMIGAAMDDRLPFSVFPTTDKGFGTIMGKFKEPASKELVGAGATGEEEI